MSRFILAVWKTCAAADLCETSTLSKCLVERKCSATKEKTPKLDKRQRTIIQVRASAPQNKPGVCI